MQLLCSRVVGCLCAHKDMYNSILNCNEHCINKRMALVVKANIWACVQQFLKDFKEVKYSNIGREYCLAL